MSRLLKIVAILFGIVVLLVITAAAVIYGKSAAAFSENLDAHVAARAIDVPMDSASIERGRHFAIAITKCTDCHTPALGGQVMIEDPAFGLIPASNLTTGEGGVLSHYDDAHLARAIRNGIAWDGRPLVFMPSAEFQHLSDEDVAAIIAFIRSVGPANNTLPATKLGPVARTLFVGGMLPELRPYGMVDHEVVPPARVAAAVDAGYGEYLARIGGCSGCHGPGLSGGRIPGTPPEFPPATNITPTGIGSWSEADFVRALREGVRPDGSAIDEFMPWRVAGQMTDDEISALWIYLQGVQPRESGTR